MVSAQPADDGFQLAHVAGPRVALEYPYGFLGEIRDLTGELALEMRDELRNVFSVLAQGRDGQTDSGQTIEEVLTELAVVNKFPQISLTRGDEPHVDLQRGEAPDRTQLSFLQDPEELRLCRQAGGADVVQVNRASLCGKKVSLSGSLRSREGSCFVAEELAFDERLRDGGAVDDDEGLVLRGAEGMNPACQQILSYAGFSAEEYRETRVSRFSYYVEHLLHHRRPALHEGGGGKRACPDGILENQGRWFLRNLGSRAQWAQNVSEQAGSNPKEVHDVRRDLLGKVDIE